MPASYRRIQVSVLTVPPARIPSDVAFTKSMRPGKAVVSSFQRGFPLFRSNPASHPSPQDFSPEAKILSPLIATWLYGTYHSSHAIAVYIAICAALSLIATAFMTDYTGKDIEREYE